MPSTQDWNGVSSKAYAVVYLEGEWVVSKSFFSSMAEDIAFVSPVSPSQHNFFIEKGKINPDYVADAEKQDEAARQKAIDWLEQNKSFLSKPNYQDKLDYPVNRDRPSR
jgi:hypothetical protein